MRTYKVAFETLGCRLNQAESAALVRSFVERGYRLADEAAEADLCVINTCALTSQAASKCRRRIRSLLRSNPRLCIAAVGCYAQTDTEILQGIEGIDYIVGTADKLRLAELIPEPRKLERPRIVKGKMEKRPFRAPSWGYYPDHTRANLKIQEGCDFVCSYCIIPRGRGPARSRDFQDALAEARALVAEGHREIVLTGVNIGTYRHGGRTLADLVKALSAIEGLLRIRISSIEPTTVGDDLLELLAEEGKLCPYLHVPLQSGDRGVLERMRRHYRPEDYLELIERLLASVPEMGLGTDVMVGFPGEDEKAFGRTVDLVEKIPFTHIHVFSFSPRRGTAAYRMGPRVSPAEIASRSREMHRLAAAKKLSYYSGQVGRRLRVIFEERGQDGLFVGFSDNYVKVGAASAGDLGGKVGIVEVEEVRGEGDELLAVGWIVEMESRDGEEGQIATSGEHARRTGVEGRVP